MQGSIRYIDGKPRELIASAKWQNLNETILGNPRKRKPDWIILFAFSHVPYNTGSSGSMNERITRAQAEALVEVLTKALAVPEGSAEEFLNLGPVPAEVL